MSHAPLIRDTAPITLIGGAPVSGDALDWALSHAPRLVAADGGAGHALAAGRMPEIVIGDMDSLSDTARARIGPARLHDVAEQDSTDLEKCLARIDTPLVIGLGFLGARLDHSLAALSLLSRTETPCLLLGPEDLAIPLGARLTLDLPRGTRLSLFPMAPVTGRSEGLRWPIDGIAFTPSGAIGTSNEVAATVRLSMDSPGMIALLPADHRDAALDALRRGG